MKLCKDCQHHLAAFSDPEKARCTQYIQYTSPVTGEKTFDFCHSARKDYNRCGIMAAQLFQPKSGD